MRSVWSVAVRHQYVQEIVGLGETAFADKLRSVLERLDFSLAAATSVVADDADQVERESQALFATGRLWDDGIVDPRDTRTVLGIALSAVHGAPIVGTTSFGVFRL